MASNQQVNWYENDVFAHFSNLSRQSLEAVAFQVESQTKQNIIASDQVDTGFMLNTVYVKNDNVSTYEQTKADGTYMGQKSGTERDVQKAPEATLPDDADAMIVVGANYAIFQEIKKPFLYPALVEVAGQAKGIIEQVAKQSG